ncbi:MAG: F0F1 ATP synthase subunit B [Treponema sp.]|jgi:F-type H+-transporting ATPase subunit b|nr:F0F1 ATP synthase subunit B [Treponema sp.]
MLVPSITTFLITLVNIGILFFVLRAVLFKPVTQFMADRTKRIEDSIAQGEKDKHQARQLFEQYERQLKGAEAEGEAIIKAARETARQEADRIAAEARAAAEAMTSAARKQLEAERKAAMALFRAEAAALVTGAAGRLLGREIDGEDSRRQAEIFLRDLARAGKR